MDGEGTVEESAAEGGAPVLVDLGERAIHRLDRDQAQAVVDEVGRHVGQHDEPRSQPQPPDHAVHPCSCFKRTPRALLPSNETLAGGRGGIRTHEGLAPLAVFKTAALSHSATLPDQCFQRLGTIPSKNTLATSGSMDPVWTQQVHCVFLPWTPFA